MYKLIIFDLDGTLANTLEDLADATNYALTKHGYPIHSLDKFNYFVGNGVPKLIERALPEEKRNPDEVKKVQADFSEYYDIHSLDKTKAYDGVAEMLGKISAMGIKTAVATNKADEFVPVILKKLFPTFKFDFIQGSVEGLAKKPDPEIVNKILGEIGVTSDKAIFIGDSDVDIKTALNSDMKSIGCTWGFRGREELKAAGATYIVDSAEEIIEIIK